MASDSGFMSAGWVTQTEKKYTQESNLQRQIILYYMKTW